MTTESYEQYYGTTDVEEVVAGIRERLNTIGSPTWECVRTVHDESFVTIKGRGFFGRVADVSSSPDDYGKANGEFIGSAPTDIAFLLDLLEAKNKRIAELGG